MVGRIRTIGGKTEQLDTRYNSKSGKQRPSMTLRAHPVQLKKKGKAKSQLHQHERGQSMVELAVSLLVLLLLLSVAIDLGRLFFSYVAVRDAAQEGALYGSLGDPNGIVPRVRDSSDNPVDLWASDVDVTWWTTPVNDFCAGNTLSVQVDFDFQLTMPLVSAIVGSEIPLSLTATSTILRPDCS